MLDGRLPSVAVRLPLGVLCAPDGLFPAGGREGDCGQRGVGPRPDDGRFDEHLPVRPDSRPDEEGGLVRAAVGLAGVLQGTQGLEDPLGQVIRNLYA